MNTSIIYNKMQNAIREVAMNRIAALTTVALIVLGLWPAGTNTQLNADTITTPRTDQKHS